MAVFKKQLTPPAGKHGRVIKHSGKGAVQQRLGAGQRENVTGGDPLARALNQYPAAPQNAPPPPAPAPPLGGPPLGATPPPPTGPAGAAGPPPDQDQDIGG